VGSPLVTVAETLAEALPGTFRPAAEAVYPESSTKNRDHGWSGVSEFWGPGWHGPTRQSPPCFSNRSQIVRYQPSLAGREESPPSEAPPPSFYDNPERRLNEFRARSAIKGRVRFEAGPSVENSSQSGRGDGDLRGRPLWSPRCWAGRTGVRKAQGGDHQVSPLLGQWAGTEGRPLPSTHNWLEPHANWAPRTALI